MTISIQKASLWKRISAWIFDLILTITIAVGAASATSAIVKYDSYVDKMDALKQHYADEYDINLDISEEEYDALSPEELERYEQADKAFREDPEAQKLNNTTFSLSILMISIGAFLGIFIWHFIIPMLFKNGQTIGKKCFSIAVMRTNSVKVSSFVLFVRSILGLYAIETMIPALMIMMLLFGTMSGVAVIVIGLIVILELVCMIMSETNASIHDLLSDTVVIDMSTQKIFESEDALIAYKEMTAAMEAAQANGAEYVPINLFGNATYRTEETENDAGELNEALINAPTNEEKNQDSESED